MKAAVVISHSKDNSEATSSATSNEQTSNYTSASYTSAKQQQTNNNIYCIKTLN